VTSCVCPAAMTAVVASPYLLRGYAAGITQACCGRNCPLRERFASGKKLLKVSVSALRADMTGRLTGMRLTGTRRMPQGRPILWMPPEHWERTPALFVGSKTSFWCALLLGCVLTLE
jgi:hypothetical protein